MKLTRVYIIIGLFLFGLAIIGWIVLVRVRRPAISPISSFPTITPWPTERFPISGSQIVPTRISGDAYPTYPPTPMPGPGKHVVSGIAVDDFSEIAPINPQGDKVLAETDDYQIVYLSQFQEFKLAITGKDFDKTQKAAEAVFLQKLGIDAPNACRLTVEVYAPNFVKNAYAGQVFPLSFCEHTDEDDQ